MKKIFTRELWKIVILVMKMKDQIKAEVEDTKEVML